MLVAADGLLVLLVYIHEGGAVLAYGMVEQECAQTAAAKGRVDDCLLYTYCPR